MSQSACERRRRGAAAEISPPSVSSVASSPDEEAKLKLLSSRTTQGTHISQLCCHRHNVMTRYTKLDKRKAPHKATDYFAASAEATSPEPQVPAAAPAANIDESSVVEQQQQASSSSKRKRSGNEDGGVETGDRSQLAAPDEGDDNGSADADPKRLHARAKLLRLKLKKTKTEDKQKTIREELKSLAKAISAANGKRGGSSNGADDATPRPKRSQREQRPAAAAEPAVVETNPWKKMEAERRAKTSAKNDVRREKRQQERAASTRCFACRSMGHAAKDCPSGLNAGSIALEGEAGQSMSSGQVDAALASIVGRETVGICFRCGSTEHTLARCRRPAPRVGSDVPFATCFVCGAKGHLSSKCPQNASRGVYPNGGCCKLCQSVEHLAKDCPLRTSSATAATNATMAAGWGSERGRRNMGADDDDFHAFARSKAEVEREEKRQKQAAATASAGAGAASLPAAAASRKGSSGAPKAQKKVISF